MNGKLAFHFRVTGVVQGVGFRWSACEQAQRLGLAGWVRNEDDGSVTGLAQGTEVSLDAFRRWLEHGPQRARVVAVDWSPTESTALRLFVVR